MRNIIKAKIKETEQDYNLMGLYSHEEYVGRMSALKELLAMLDKEDDKDMIDYMYNLKDEQEIINARQAEEDQLDEMSEADYWDGDASWNE